MDGRVGRIGQEGTLPMAPWLLHCQSRLLGESMPRLTCLTLPLPDLLRPVLTLPSMLVPRTTS